MVRASFNVPVGHLGFPGGSEVKNLPAMWETWVWSLGWEDPLEKGMATHSSILAWRSPWTEKPGQLQSMESARVGHNWASNTGHLYVFGKISIQILCPVLMALFTFLLLSCMRFLYILFLPSGDLPYPGVKPGSPELQADSLPSEPPGKFPYFFWILAPYQIYDMQIFSPI